MPLPRELGNRAGNAWNSNFYPLRGTLNYAAPAIETPPGDCIDGLNYEAHPRGYKRIDGIERYDGRPRPSDASYSVLNFDQGTAAVLEGVTVTGLSSGATGKALIDGVVETGAYGTSDAAGYLVLTTVSGAFTDNEALQVGGVTKCHADGTATEDGATNDTDDDTWTQDAIETARALIQNPTGSGAILGGFVYNGVNHCFRDSGGQGKLYKATASGWVEQALGYRVRYSSGSAAVTAGQTITGASSGATGVVTRVVLRTGSTGAGNAAGLFTFASITGTFTNGENLQVGGVTKAVANGASAAITLPANGDYRCVVENFYGASNLRRVYVCNGVGTAFEWDGSVCVPIETGMTVDTPHRIAVHKMHLFLAFPGGSRQHSGTADPYAWSPVLGAAELAFGEEITEFAEDFSGLLITLGRNKIDALYGNDSSDWTLQTITGEAGGLSATSQRLGNLIYQDDRGLRDLRTTANYGDVLAGTLSEAIAPFFPRKRASNAFPVASMACKEKNSYRVFYSDGTGVSMLLGEKRARLLLFTFGDILIRNAWSGEDDDGNEIMFLGAENGTVYELDAGTSLDGDAIPAFIRLPFNHVGSPGQNKRWHKAALEGDFPANANIGVVAEFDYGGEDQPSVIEQRFAVTGGGGAWDESSWDEFRWDSAVEGRAECRLEGSGRNCSITIISEATYETPHILHGLTLFFTPRRQMR